MLLRQNVENNSVLNNNLISYLDQNGLRQGSILQNITNFQNKNKIDMNSLKRFFMCWFKSFVNSFDELSKID